LLVSRRVRRPLSQSSQLIEPSIGMQGTLGFEFIGNFSYQFLTLRKITIFREIGKSPQGVTRGKNGVSTVPTGRKPTGPMVPALGAGLISRVPPGPSRPVTAAPECSSPPEIVSRQRRCKCRSGRCWRPGRRRRDQQAGLRPCVPACQRRRWPPRAHRPIH